MCTSVSRSLCTYTVTLSIEFQNNSGLNAAQFQTLVDGWETAIEDMWNGPRGYQDFGCCRVRFNVVTRIGSGTANFHQINIVAGPQTSFVNQLGPGCTGGRWDALDIGNVAAHESGHLLGPPDEYDYNGPGNGYQNLNPQPAGQPQSIMAQTWDNVAALQSHIDGIMNGLNVKCPWWCCILKWFYRLLTAQKVVVTEAKNIITTQTMDIPDRLAARDMPAEKLIALIESGKPDAMSVGTDGLIEQGIANQDYLIALLQNDNPLARWGAVMALSHIESVEAGETLSGALADANISVRLTAAHGLMNRGDNAGAAVLKQALDSDEILYGHPPILASERARQILSMMEGK